MKILLNGCYGGFDFSDEFIREMCSKYDIPLNDGRLPYYQEVIDAMESDTLLIEEVEKFGLSEASGTVSQLYIEEIADGLEYSVREYDGVESLDETWINVSLEELINGLSEEKLALAKQASCIKIIKTTKDGKENM